MFFSVFLCFWACRNQTVILGFLALFLLFGFPILSALLLTLISLPWQFLGRYYLSGVSFFRLSRIPRAVFVGGVGVGFRMARGASGARRIREGETLAGCQTVEQMSDLRLSNKFTKQVFEWLFGPVWQNFQPNLTEF